MKERTLLVVFDAEGLPGIKTWTDVCANFKTEAPTQKLIKIATETINMVVKGAEKAGVNKIIILDWHENGQNIPRNGIKKLFSTKLTILKGNGSNFKFALSKADCGILIGMHGKYGSADGNPPLHAKEFNKKGSQGVGHVWAFSIKSLFINGKSVGESILLHKVLAEQSIPLLFVLGTPSAIREVKKYDPRIKTLSNKNCSYETIQKTLASKLKQKRFKVRKPTYNTMSILFKKPKDPEIDTTIVLVHRNEFESMNSKKTVIKDRQIIFKPTTKTPFLETFYLMSLRKFE